MRVETLTSFHSSSPPEMQSLGRPNCSSATLAVTDPYMAPSLKSPLSWNLSANPPRKAFAAPVGPTILGEAGWLKGESNSPFEPAFESPAHPCSPQRTTTIPFDPIAPRNILP